MNMTHLRMAALTLAMATGVSASNILTENFDNVADLASAGWTNINLSNPPGPTSWFQGNSAIFGSHSGLANSYAAANLLATGDTGDIDVALILPVLTLNNGDVVSFYTRTEAPVSFADNLEVRLNTATALNILLLAINPSLNLTSYPTDWTRFTVTISGLSGPTDARLAFHYVVPDGGALGSNSNYIGLDTLSIDAVPEPATWLAGLGLAAVAVLKSNKIKNKK